MAIVICPECKKDVSTLAAACPHCGAPVSALAPKANAKPTAPRSQEKESIVGKIIVWAALPLIVIGIGCAIVGFARDLISFFHGTLGITTISVGTVGIIWLIISWCRRS